jgi:predicted phosphoribosyltransferase
MIFKSRQEAAQKIIKKLAESNSKDGSFFYLTPDSQNMTDFVSHHFKKESTALFDLLGSDQKIPDQIIIIDDGGVDAEEINEYTDLLRQKNKKVKITLAIAVIAEPELKKFEQLVDQFIYLHADPLFFNINQFYQN